VFGLCWEYYSEVKDAREDIKRLRDEVKSLQDVLIKVADLVDAPGTKLSVMDLLSQPDGPVQQCLKELQIGQNAFLAGERRQKIHQWLSPPDPSSNHNTACKKRQQTTGSWFIRGDQFAEWKISSNTFLWLHGIRRLTSLRG
jgi:hypothetical protein